MATILDKPQPIETRQGPDGVFRVANPAEELIRGVEAGIGVVEAFIRSGRTVRNLADGFRVRIREIGATVAREANPGKAPRRKPRKRHNPDGVVDGEEC